jgi:hypothetical protein
MGRFCASGFLLFTWLSSLSAVLSSATLQPLVRPARTSACRMALRTASRVSCKAKSLTVALWPFASSTACVSPMFRSTANGAAGEFGHVRI